MRVASHLAVVLPQSACKYKRVENMLYKRFSFSVVEKLLQWPIQKTRIFGSAALGGCKVLFGRTAVQVKCCFALSLPIGILTSPIFLNFVRSPQICCLMSSPHDPMHSLPVPPWPGLPALQQCPPPSFPLPSAAVESQRWFPQCSSFIILLSFVSICLCLTHSSPPAASHHSLDRGCCFPLP